MYTEIKVPLSVLRIWNILAPEGSFAELCKNSQALWANVATTRPVGSGNYGARDRPRTNNLWSLDREICQYSYCERDWMKDCVIVVGAMGWQMSIWIFFCEMYPEFTVFTTFPPSTHTHTGFSLHSSPLIIIFFSPSPWVSEPSEISLPAYVLS